MLPDPAPLDEAINILIRARALINRGWCQHTAAQNILRWRVSKTSRWASRFCLTGAIERAYHDAGGPDPATLCNRISGKLTGPFTPYTANQLVTDAIGYPCELTIVDDQLADLSCMVALMLWNDKQHRTKADVLGAIDKAIAIGRERLKLAAHTAASATAANETLRNLLDIDRPREQRELCDA